MIDFSKIDVIVRAISNIIFAIGAIEVIRFLSRRMYHPNISVTDVELVKYNPKDFEGIYVDLKWRVHNNPRLVWFGNYLILMKTMFFVGRGDKGEWHWSGTKSGPSNLPVTEKTFQIKNWINEEFPQGTYRVYLIIFSEDKVVFKKSFEVPLKDNTKI